MRCPAVAGSRHGCEAAGLCAAENAQKTQGDPLHQLGTRSGRVALGFAAIAGLLVVSSTTASSGMAAFSGNLCAIMPAGSLAELKINEPCVVVQKGSARVQSTPLGSVR